MTSGIRKHLTFANVASGLSLFLVLTGGTAVALSGSNTVFSDDIVNDEVRTQDIRTGHVGNTDLGANSVTSGKVADNNLTGNDINELSLGKVPNADRLDGVDSSQFQRVGLVQAGAANEFEDEGFAFVVRWDELAQFTTDGDGDTDGTVRVFNSGSQDLIVRIDSDPSTIIVGPGGAQPFDVTSLHTFLVWSADGARSWLVTCGKDHATSQIRCHGVANRLG